jgi:DNA replication protein DnaC
MEGEQPMAQAKSQASSRELKSEQASARNEEAKRKDLEKKVRESHEFIKDRIVEGPKPSRDVRITAQFGFSETALGDYVTLDWKHIEEIASLMKAIRDYARDRSRRRPLNIIMHAEPGSGKSHFIKCLAKKMSEENISPVTFNMATLQGADDFIQPLEAVRNLKVVDKLPLLFLDEFDSNSDNYALLLPLLWDGELSVGHRELRIGKVVIILAGSGAQIAKVMNTSKDMQSDSATEAGKLPDLLSRINGGELTIPGLDEQNETRDRRVDKVCLTLSILRQRFTGLEEAPWALLRFVAQTKFRYGVRSIMNLIDLIPWKDSGVGTLLPKDLHLPLDTEPALQASTLAYHLCANGGAKALVETWNEVRSVDTTVNFVEDWLTYAQDLDRYGSLFDGLTLD